MLLSGLSDDSIKNLFLNDLNSLFKSTLGPLIDNSQTITIDYDTEHKINNYGFRDDDFLDTADILIGGCSFTYGYSLDQKYIWAEIIKKSTGKNTANIGFSGNSITTIIYEIFAYIRKFGKPKTILCLFPDLYRITLPVIPKKLFDSKIKEHKDYVDKNNFPTMLWTIDVKKYDQPKFSQIPHEISDVIPDIVSAYMAIQHIHLLEQFCDLLDIQLVWATWNLEAHEVFKKIQSLSDKTYFKYYAGFIDGGQYAEPKEYDCHLDLKSEDQETFLFARDKNHYGSHTNAHFANFFYNAMKGKSK